MPSRQFIIYFELADGTTTSTTISAESPEMACYSLGYAYCDSAASIIHIFSVKELVPTHFNALCSTTDEVPTN